MNLSWRELSYAPAVEGKLRTLSRAAAIAILLLALVVLRLGQPVWFTLALLAVAAFESSSMIQRTLEHSVTSAARHIRREQHA